MRSSCWLLLIVLQILSYLIDFQQELWYSDCKQKIPWNAVVVIVERGGNNDVRNSEKWLGAIFE